MGTQAKVLVAAGVAVTVTVVALVAMAVGLVLGMAVGDAEYRFCQQAESQSYCLDHPEKGDDVRLGA
jgi:hypothetical protein